MKTRRHILCLFGLVVFLAAVLLAGCVGEARYSPSEISGYPENIQKLIKEGVVEMGMTPDEVRFAWGAPTYINILPPAPDGRQREEWVYKENLGISGTTLVFSGGKVTEMSSKGLTNKKFISPGSAQ